MVQETFMSAAYAQNLLMSHNDYTHSTRNRQLNVIDFISLADVDPMSLCSSQHLHVTGTHHGERVKEYNDSDDSNRMAFIKGISSISERREQFISFVFSRANNVIIIDRKQGYGHCGKKDIYLISSDKHVERLCSLCIRHSIQSTAQDNM